MDKVLGQSATVIDHTLFIAFADPPPVRDAISRKGTAST